MPTTQLLIVIFLSILGACAFLALGAFLGKKISMGKVAAFAGIVALFVMVFFSVFSAYYFITKL